MYRIKDLSLTLSVPAKILIKEFCIRHRKSFFCKFDNIWFQFPSAKHVIIPKKEVIEYVKKKSGKLSSKVLNRISTSDLNNADFSHLNSNKYFKIN